MRIVLIGIVNRVLLFLPLNEVLRSYILWDEEGAVISIIIEGVIWVDNELIRYLIAVDIDWADFNIEAVVDLANTWWILAEIIGLNGTIFITAVTIYVISIIAWLYALNISIAADSWLTQTYIINKVSEIAAKAFCQTSANRALR